MKNRTKKIIIVALFFTAVFFTPAIFSQFVFADSLLVTTYPVSGTNTTGAYLHGFVSNPQGYSTVFFEWGDSYLLNNKTGTQGVSHQGSFDWPLFQLSAGKTYYYRAAAFSNTTQEVAYGTTLDFTTSSGNFVYQSIPTVDTRSANGISSVSATLNGSVNPQGSLDTVRWFEWGRTSSLGNTTPKASQGTNAGDFAYSLSNLEPNTTYYFRAAAQNSTGPAFGSTYSFITGGNNILPITPTTGVSPLVITQAPKVVNDDNAVLAGTAFPGGTIVTRGWFEWGRTSSLGNQTIVKDIGNATSIGFSEEISNLSSNTVYYYRAVIENERGKAIGTTLSLTTGGTTYNPPVTPEKPKTPTKPTVTTTTPKTNGAAAIGVLNCLPNSLTGWLVILLLVILIVIAIDHLVDRYKKRKEENKRREDINQIGKDTSGPRVIK